MEDKYTIIKCSLQEFCIDVKWMNVIQDAVERANRIVTEGYHLLNLHVRRLIEEEKDIPKLDEKYIIQFMEATQVPKEN